MQDERGTKRKADDEDVRPVGTKRIRPLDQDVVNKIAAGEIIVAPVHALKELIENAVDAGSTALEVLVKDGGMKLLQITDNGHGINKDDLPILCERFTTSKLKEFEDLMSMSTYGFRGEALASISHIAHLTVTTKVKESSCAWRAHYSAGKLTPQKPGQTADPKPTAGRQGTQITVEDLFYNVPTRRKAFHSASEEYSQILEMVGKYAVHCQGVAFSCKKHGDSSIGVLVQQDATKNDRIRSIHGNSVARELIHVEVKDENWGFEADAYVTNANYNAKKLKLLLFINHRAVESTAIKKAVDSLYANFLPKGGHPFVYLSLQIEPQRVDVNVHPTKRQVNFLNEDEIIDLICEGIRVKLGSVDTSRTFTTQSLLPGRMVPTISSSSTNTPAKPAEVSAADDTGPGARQPSTWTPVNKPYENNLVRTDSRAQKITAFMRPTQTRPVRSPPRDDSVNRQESLASEATENGESYIITDKKRAACKLTSVLSLRASVRSGMHNGLTEIFTTHTYVGLVDHARRIAAIQSGVKLYLVDFGLLCAEYFYQLGLTDFSNFGSMLLDPPLDLREVLQLAAEDEQESLAEGEDMDLDWEDVVDTTASTLIERRAMLSEYFSLDITDDGLLRGLPLLIKGYMPSLGKLPRFLLRLGPHVDWSDERNCFRTFLRELATWYVPEALPNGKYQSVPKGPEDDAMDVEDAQRNGGQADDAHGESEDVAKRRHEISTALESVLFPAFKARILATKGMSKGVVEVADLKGLYRVFERC